MRTVRGLTSFMALALALAAAPPCRADDGAQAAPVESADLLARWRGEAPPASEGVRFAHRTTLHGVAPSVGSDAVWRERAVDGGALREYERHEYLKGELLPVTGVVVRVAADRRSFEPAAGSAPLDERLVRDLRRELGLVDLPTAAHFDVRRLRDPRLLPRDAGATSWTFDPALLLLELLPGIDLQYAVERAAGEGRVASERPLRIELRATAPVTHVGGSPCLRGEGRALATVELRPDGGSSRELRIELAYEREGRPPSRYELQVVETRDPS